MIQKLITGAFLVLILGEYLVGDQYLNLTQYPGELCNSKCIKGQSRVCYFEFVLEHYHALGPACGGCQQGNTADCLKPQCIIGDGFQKGVMSINRMIPGPPIYACVGDQIVVDVKNMAHGTAAAIHWHGLHMMETPYMDGVPYVTQCPIPFESTFRYVFKATQAGTHFYHSHSGLHKLNGQYGALIIREPDVDNPQIEEYDYDLSEHYILISDWRHEYAENSFPGLPKGVSFPESFLINGRGSFVTKNTFQRTVVPVTTYHVMSGAYYKFKAIHSGTLTCAITLQIEGHPLTVIATDSYPVEPFKVNTLVMNAGERYDFIINANLIKGDFWIRIRGLPSCQTQPTDSFAMLRYINQNSDYKRAQPALPAYGNTYPMGVSLNHPQATCFDNDNAYCVSDLTALEKDTDLVTRKPDYKFKFSFYNYVFPVEKGFIPGKYVRFDNPDTDVIATGVVNNISLILPPTPMLIQYNEVDKSKICDRSNCPQQCGGEPTRECIHVVKVKTNSIVEMAIHDAALVDDLDHPFHLHGYRFAVMGITTNSTNLDKSIEFAGRYRTNRPVLKDTISVPMNGVTVVRFRANNPGLWMMHCHYELHLATGMAFIVQVGEPSEWVQAPSDFPKCRNYKPEVRRGYY